MGTEHRFDRLDGRQRISLQDDPQNPSQHGVMAHSEAVTPCDVHTRRGQIRSRFSPIFLLRSWVCMAASCAESNWRKHVPNAPSAPAAIGRRQLLANLACSHTAELVTV